MCGNNGATLESRLPLPLPEKELNELIEKSKDWALMHGMCMRSRAHFNPEMLQYAPFALLPSPFPRKEFAKACQIQPILNMLIHKVAQDFEFLKETLQETIKVDCFTRELFNICTIINAEGPAQKISLGLLRSDLMLDTSCPASDECDKQKPYCCWKQVEINTIASGFGWLGPAASQLHKYVLGELGLYDQLSNIPENNALKMLCSGMIKAWHIYDNKIAVILFVIEDMTYNICDQRFHEFEIRKQNPNIRVIRRNLTQLAASAKLGPNKELIVDDLTVAVVYYRCGYEPGQYHTRKEWDVRLLIERSLAIVCPSIQYHLAGTKKVQQALAKPGVISKFLNDKNTVDEVKEIFTGLYALDLNAHGNAALEMGIKNPNMFVLKPQREGGCNNMYGTDIRDFLLSVKDKEDRVAWILMDKIQPPVHRNYIVRPSNTTNTEVKDLVSELGIFGVIIADDKTIYTNEQAGHMLRTKLVTANEGGVATALSDVIHAVARYGTQDEPREIFFFREGAIVLWNVPDLECGNILNFLKEYEENPHAIDLIKSESEVMTYCHSPQGRTSAVKNGCFVLGETTTVLEKYTFSNVMLLSVKLGISESTLDNYIDSIEFVTQDLRSGKRLKLTQHEVLRKQGELFALRHEVNLSSDLLDTPDFYWERDDLEILYHQACNYFNISKRTKVINDKLNHCLELVGLLSTNLSDSHHVRLEWMIIVLIMVEVAFETLHYIDRFLA